MNAKLCLAAVLLAILAHTTTAAFYDINRRWFVGGEFASVVNATGAVLTVNNIAYFDGNNWFGMNGTNGAVNAIYADQCLNVYIAGKFTTAGGVNTGSVAVWKYGQSNWQSVGPTPFAIGTSDTVNAIIAECLSVPTSLSSVCTCDVYVGGKFTFTAPDGAAVNVAKYTAKEDKWSYLGGATASKFTTSDQVDALYKKSGNDKVFIGGSFSGLFKYYDNNAKTFSSGLLTGVSSPNSPYVAAIAYDVNFFTTDVLYIGGDFKTSTCSYVCQYNHKTGVLSSVGTSGGPDGPVSSLSYNGNGIYAVGLFGSGTTQRNIAFHKDDAPTWTTALQASGQSLPTTFPGQSDSGYLTGVYSCGTLDIKCKANSFAVIGTNGTAPYVQYYDTSASNTFNSFGQGIPSGSVVALYSKVWSSAPSVAVNIVLAVACIVISLFAL